MAAPTLRSALIAALAAALGALATYLAVPPAIAPVSVDVHVPDTVQVRVPIAEMLAARDATMGQPVAVVAVAGGSDTVLSQAGKAARAGPARRLAYALARSRVSADLQRTGYAGAGGDPTPLSRAEADRAAEKLTDGVIDGAGAVYGMPTGDAGGEGEPGRLLAFVLGLLEWIKENPEFIRFLLSLLMLL